MQLVLMCALCWLSWLGVSWLRVPPGAQSLCQCAHAKVSIPRRLPVTSEFGWAAIWLAACTTRSSSGSKGGSAAGSLARLLLVWLQVKTQVLLVVALLDGPCAAAAGAASCWQHLALQASPPSMAAWSLGRLPRLLVGGCFLLLQLGQLPVTLLLLAPLRAVRIAAAVTQLCAQALQLLVYGSTQASLHGVLAAGGLLLLDDQSLALMWEAVCSRFRPVEPEAADFDDAASIGDHADGCGGWQRTHAMSGCRPCCVL